MNTIVVRPSGVNDSGLIQNAINQACDRNNLGDVILDVGKFYIKDTINIPNTTGFALIGQGQMHADTRITGHWGSVTELIWIGEPNKPMINLIGSSAATIKDMTLYGRSQYLSGPQTSSLIHCKPQDGFDNSNHQFENLTFIDSDIGIRMGDVQFNPNCADCVYTKLSFLHCNTAFKTENDQSVNHHFRMINADSCKSVIWAKYGGNINVFGGSFTACGGSGLDDWIIRIDHAAQNNAVSSFNNIRFEYLSNQFIKIGPYNHININDCNECNGLPNNRFAEVNGGRLIIRGTLLQSSGPDLIKITNGGHVIVKDSTFWSRFTSKYINREKHSTFIIDNCTNGWNTPIKNHIYRG
jgi:hypothetical protein